MLLPHPSNSPLVQFDHFSGMWRVKSPRQGLHVRCSSVSSPCPTQALHGWVNQCSCRDFPAEAPGNIFLCQRQLVWGRQSKQGAVPEFVERNWRKSIGKKIQPYFLKANKAASSVVRRSKAKQGSQEKKPPDPLAFVRQRADVGGSACKSPCK